jgi:transcriptional regulator GlxA family with amidase domain
MGGRTVHIAGGIPVGAEAAAGRYDLLIVPGLEITRHVNWTQKLGPLSREVAFIRKTFAAGTPVASACVGAFLLGEAGLLNGRTATTAWLFAPELAKRYPMVKLQADAVLLEDGAVITTGAVSSAFDLAIHLAKRYLGAEVAAATARVALLPGQRASQAPFVDRQLMGQNLPSFSHNLAQWFQQRLTDDYDLQRVAQAFHVSASTLMRRTKAETGKSPLTLLQHARVDKAKQLLLSTTWGIEHITEQVGYSDPTTFSRLFSRVVGETPARFRRRNLTP